MYRSIDFHGPAALGGMALIVLFAIGAHAARGEFKIDEEIPEFSLRTADGKTVELQREKGRVSVKLADERREPRALVIHLLQPDCLQCRNQLEALKPVAEQFAERGVITLGIAHRGTKTDAAALVESLDPGFPIAICVGSEIGERYAAGDTLAIADAKGIVRFAQVGYGEGDRKLWEQALEELLAGKTVTKTGVERKRLAAGQQMPAIELPSLRNDKPMRLASEPRRVSERESEPRRVSERTDQSLRPTGRRLLFRDDEGNESHPKAAVGFFSRY